MKIVKNPNSIILRTTNFILVCSNAIFPLYEGFSMTGKVKLHWLNEKEQKTGKGK